MNVTPGPFAVLDADGIALCHAPSQNKSANSKVKRAARELWLASLADAGMVTDDGIMCNDGIVRPRGAGETERDGYADFGHIIADTLGGAYCGCNAVAQGGTENRNSGDVRPVIAAGYDVNAYGEAFRARAIAAMTSTKRARVV
jgi:hypothetical protein